MSSCAFLTSDIFPSWLSFADANLDLRGLVRGFGAVDEPESLYVEYLQTVGGPAYIAVLYYEGTAWRLVFLDPEDMGYLASLKEPGFSPFLGAGSGGDIVCGTVSVAAATLTSQTPAPTSLPGGGRAYLVRAGAGANQYIVGSPDSSNVAWIQYDSAWTSFTPGTIGAVDPPAQCWDGARRALNGAAAASMAAGIAAPWTTRRTRRTATWATNAESCFS